MENSVESYSMNLSRKIATRVNVVLMLIHIMFFIGFYIMKIYLMVYVNIFSIIVYIASFALLKKDGIPLYLRLVYVEILMHMSLATIAIGWDCGYQLYCFSAIPIIYYCDFLGKQAGFKRMVNPNLIALLIAILFLCIRLYCSMRIPMYDISLAICRGCFMMNTLFTFGFLAIYMRIYEKSIMKSSSILQNQAEQDQLTKIGNRYYMNRYLENNYKEAIASGKNIAMAIIDIDDFKHINDTYGHDFGDAVLCNLASKLEALENDTTKICRWGGEEFLVLSLDYNGKEALKEKLESLLQQVRNSSVEYNGVKITMSFTAGISGHHEKDKTYHQVIKRADQKLYRGKNKAKNQVVC